MSESPQRDVENQGSAAERIPVDEYRRRAALGDLSVSKDFELLEGVVTPKARQTLRHEAALENIQSVLGKLLPEGWHLRVQQPFAHGESQPEPDVIVVQSALDDFATRPPGPGDPPLIIEVADASLILDRRVKLRIYARAKILNYWLLNVIDNQLEVFTNPSGPVAMPGYGEQRIYRTDDKISLVIGLDDLGMVRVGDLLP